MVTLTWLIGVAWSPSRAATEEGHSNGPCRGGYSLEGTDNGAGEDCTNLY